MEWTTHPLPSFELDILSAMEQQAAQSCEHRSIKPRWYRLALSQNTSARHHDYELDERDEGFRN